MIVIYIILIVIFLLIVILIREYRITTNEIKIRVVETWYSEHRNLFYKAEYKQKGSLFWFDILEYKPIYNKVDYMVKKTSEGFNHFSSYNYEQISKHNLYAYELKKKSENTRSKNKYRIL